LNPLAFGRFLADEMERVDVSQRELAVRAGVDHSTISRLLAGREPKLTTAIRLAKGLDSYDGERSGR
jgi:transcriptional regulator with XRE-family HTH domain